MKEKLTLETWIGWLGALIAATAATVFVLMSYAFANFETKERAQEREVSFEKRLDRIDGKLDDLLFRIPRK